MKSQFQLLFLATLLCFACKDSTKTSPAPTTPTSPKLEVPASPKSTSSTSTKANVSELKQEKPLTAHAIQFYTSALWRYEAAVVIKDPEKSKAYNGKWIKFHPNNTIKTGFYDGEVKTGSWAIDEEKNLITIMEGGERPTLSEWSIKTSSNSDAIMIWVGTKRFNTNNTQIKMKRYNVKPSR